VDSNSDHLPDSRTSPTRKWQVVAASECGASHLRLGKPCDDSCSWLLLSDETLIAVVADGAGSASHGGLGALTAVSAIKEAAAGSVLPSSNHIEEVIVRQLVTSCVLSARRSVETEAESLGLVSTDLSTTLIVLLATPSCVGICHIGDGAVVLRGKDGEMLTLSKPEESEFVNETVFLTSQDFSQTVPFKFWLGELGQFAMFSDGLQNVALKLPADEPHKPFFEPLFRLISEEQPEIVTEQLHAFLLSDRLRSRTDDDVTILVAHLP
jgi:Protein phosphatase 2C